MFSKLKQNRRNQIRWRRSQKTHGGASDLGAHLTSSALFTQTRVEDLFLGDWLPWKWSNWGKFNMDHKWKQGRKKKAMSDRNAVVVGVFVFFPYADLDPVYSSYSAFHGLQLISREKASENRFSVDVCQNKNRKRDIWSNPIIFWSILKEFQLSFKLWLR